MTSSLSDEIPIEVDEDCASEYVDLKGKCQKTIAEVQQDRQKNCRQKGKRQCRERCCVCDGQVVFFDGRCLCSHESGQCGLCEVFV